MTGCFLEKIRVSVDIFELSDIFSSFFDFSAGILFLTVYYEIRQHLKCIEKVKVIRPR